MIFHPVAPLRSSQPLGTCTVQVLALRIRNQDYRVFLDEVTVAAVDGRLLDTASFGGFLGRGLGVFAINQRPADQLDR